MDSVFVCAFCFQPNTIFVDATGGEHQAYVEDCQVCCQPNRLYIRWEEADAAYWVDSEPES